MNILNKLYIPNQFWIEKSEYESDHIIHMCAHQEIRHCVLNEQNKVHRENAAAIILNLRGIILPMDIQNV